jgi:phosphoribosyl 1,2-cyclic phosphate phosphodiesterase
VNELYAHNKANHFEDQGALIYVFRKDGIGLLCGNDTGFFYEEVWDGLRQFKLDVVLLDCTHGKDDNWDNHMGVWQHAPEL